MSAAVDAAQNAPSSDSSLSSTNPTEVNDHSTNNNDNTTTEEPYNSSTGLRQRRSTASSSDKDTISSLNDDNNDDKKKNNSRDDMTTRIRRSIRNILNRDFEVVAQQHVALTQEQIKAKESRTSRIILRVSLGALMLCFFVALVYLGHTYICAFVIFVEIAVFKELVRVRYSTFFDDMIRDQIPLFRTTQWMWFCVASFYTYGDFLQEHLQNNQRLHYLLEGAQYLSSISFILYSSTFVITIATFQREKIRFQINQLCYTVLILCLTIGQLKYVMHNVFNGLIWFVLPCCLVFCNDIMAYVCGMIWGRKFIQRPFIRFSPNKTWEGFIGGGICTMILAWFLAGFLAEFTWMACPTNEFRLIPEPLHCKLDPIFSPSQAYIPSQVFDLFPVNLIKVLPRVVEICSVKNSTASAAGNSGNITSASALTMTPCVSGEKMHVHHHFELTFRDYYPIQVHAVWLAMFASLVAPFGGFLASAIKRAYGVKDFDSIIPGHGGVMDRMDCQFLMALCTWVHYNTFVKLASVSVPKLYYMYSLLSDQEKREFIETIQVVGKKKKNFSEFGL